MTKRVRIYEILFFLSLLWSKIIIFFPTKTEKLSFGIPKRKKENRKGKTQMLTSLKHPVLPIVLSLFHTHTHTHTPNHPPTHAHTSTQPPTHIYTHPPNHTHLLIGRVQL